MTGLASATYKETRLREYMGEKPAQVCSSQSPLLQDTLMVDNKKRRKKWTTNPQSNQWGRCSKPDTSICSDLLVNKGVL